MAKPAADGFCVVTASCNLERDAACIASWQARARYRWPTFILLNAPDAKEQEAAWRGAPDRPTVLWIPEYKGPVAAFALGVEAALRAKMQIVACLHSDLLIEDAGWDQGVLDWFQLSPRTGLVGFGGGTGLGALDLYQAPYSPHQLARTDFVSNLREAEQHGRRALKPERVACLDGFSLIGRREFWRGQQAPHLRRLGTGINGKTHENLFARLADAGMTHHWYDGQLGVEAKRRGWEVWMLPIGCHHFGGRTAVADQGYHQWAESVVPGGDKTFWELAHSIGYELSRGVLPIRVGK